MDKVIQVVEDAGVEEKRKEFRRLESFLEVLTGSTIEFRLGLQCNRVLKKYRERKRQEEESKDMWMEINARKPDATRNDPKDEVALRKAAATIGDYKLRTDPAYINTENESSSTSRKFQQLIRIRQELAAIRNEYNHRVFHLRHKKQVLVKYVEDQRMVVQQMQREMAPELHNFPFDFPTNLLHLEYPERNIEYKIPVEPPNNKYIMKDEFYLFTRGFNQITPFLCNPVLYKKMLKESDRATNTMIDLIAIRREETVFDQNQRVADIEHRIYLFDSDMKKVLETRLEVEVAAKFLDIFLLTVYQELWVLRDFKQLEDNLVDSVDEQVTDQNSINTELNTLKANIEKFRKNIDQGAIEEKAIQQQFQTSVGGNKFWDFLRKIFKKKFRVEKIAGSDESDESSVLSEESSTEEEDDAESRDSAEIGPIHMDETVCPVGCDRPLYDLTFTLRSNRHRVEQKMRDEQAAIENCNAKIDKLQRQRKGVESKLKVRQDELQAFRQVKQKTLNEIETIVVIRMNQMQHFQNPEEFSDIPNTLLFNNECISSLYARVAQIEFETIQARRRHRANVTHLSRMKTDCKHMEKKMKDLDEEYDEEMIKKFGMKVNLDELEEGVLRKMVFEIQANTADIQKEYNAKATELRKEHAKQQEHLKCMVLREIERLNVLTVLQEENNLLQGMAIQQNSESPSKMDTAAWEQDIARLSAIAKQQKLEIQAIFNEIQMLGLKEKNFTAIAIAEHPENNKFTYKEQRTNYTESEFSYQTQTTGRSAEMDSSNITRIVKHFFEKLQSKIDVSELKTLLNEVTALFVASANVFQESSENKEELQHVAEQFQNLIPTSLLRQISYSDIATLFQNIAIALQRDDDTNPLEILRCVLEETFDSMLQSKESISTQDFIVQSLKDILMSMSMDQLMDSAVTLQVASTISHMVRSKTSVHSSVDKTEIVGDLVAFAEENVIEGADEDVFEAVIRSILDDITNNIE